ncbi:MAG: hypothetical protein ACM30G_14985 [Micromonosporaceae bacterium]
MTTLKDSQSAGREARHDQQTHPERPSHHEDAIRTYLSGLAYAEAHDLRDEPTEDEDGEEKDRHSD